MHEGVCWFFASVVTCKNTKAKTTHLAVGDVLSWRPALLIAKHTMRLLAVAYLIYTNQSAGSDWFQFSALSILVGGARSSTETNGSCLMLSRACF